MMNQNLRSTNLQALSATPNRSSSVSWPAILLFGAAFSLFTATTDTLAQDQSQAPAEPNQAAQSASGQRTDGQIEMDVVHALDAAPALKPDWITAGTVQGEVTLSGTSGSEANRQLAESIAAKVSGVTKVVNDLKVGNPQQAADQSGAQPQDQQDPSTQSAQQGQQDQYPGQYQGQYPSQNQASNQPQYPQQDQQQASNGSMPPPQPRPTYRPFPNNNQYANQPQQPMPPAQPEPPQPPVTLAEGTLLKVRTTEPLDSKMAREGSPVEFTVVRDVYAGGVLAIPRGATVYGEVTKVKKAGALGGSPELALQLNTLQLGNQRYELDIDPFEVKGPNKAGGTARNAVGGAVLGAIIGGAFGGGSGAAIGAAAGGVGGTAASAATPGPRIWIPSEAVLNFHLNDDLTVTPVSQYEAQRLAASAGQGPGYGQRPTLYRRGGYQYGGYPPPPPPPGYYPPN